MVLRVPCTACSYHAGKISMDGVSSEGSKTPPGKLQGGSYGVLGSGLGPPVPYPCLGGFPYWGTENRLCSPFLAPFLVY